MSFEFMYAGKWYKYDQGWIQQRQGSSDFYIKICPVNYYLHDKLDSLSADQLKSIMEAILHGYYHGFTAGRRDKIKEVKRVLDLD